MVVVVRLLGKPACWSVPDTARKLGAGPTSDSSFDFTIGVSFAIFYRYGLLPSGCLRLLHTQMATGASDYPQWPFAWLSVVDDPSVGSVPDTLVGQVHPTSTAV